MSKDPPDVDDIVSQCFFAMGTGAGMPIKSDAVKALRDKYRQKWTDVLKNYPDAWDENGHAVLDYCRAVGRLAAQEAIKEGANRIGTTHTLYASQKVQDWVQPQLTKDTMFCV